MEPQDETMFKKPEESRPKTPTPYEEDNERPAKVRKVYGEKPEKMMSVLRKKQSNSFLGNMVALHDTRSSPDVFWWEGDILVPASYNNSKFLMVEDTCYYYTWLIGAVTNQEPRKTIGYCFENNRLYCFPNPRWRRLFSANQEVN